MLVSFCSVDVYDLICSLHSGSFRHYSLLVVQGVLLGSPSCVLANLALT